MDHTNQINIAFLNIRGQTGINLAKQVQFLTGPSTPLFKGPSTPFLTGPSAPLFELAGPTVHFPFLPTVAYLTAAVPLAIGKLFLSII